MKRWDSAEDEGTTLRGEARSKIIDVLRVYGGDMSWDDLRRDCVEKSSEKPSEKSSIDERTFYDNISKMADRDIVEYLGLSGEKRVNLLDQVKRDELKYFDDCLGIIRFSALNQEVSSDDQLDECFDYLRKISYRTGFSRVILLRYLEDKIIPLIKELAKKQQPKLKANAVYMLANILQSLWGTSRHSNIVDNSLELLNILVKEFPSFTSKWEESSDLGGWTLGTVENYVLRGLFLTNAAGFEEAIKYMSENALRLSRTPTRSELFSMLLSDLPGDVKSRFKTRRFSLLSDKDENVRELFKHATAYLS